MSARIGDLLERLNAADTLDRLRDVAGDWARELGLPHVVYGCWNPARPDENAILGTYPDAWLRRYVEKNYFALDPVVRDGASGVLPFVWGDAPYRHRFSAAEKALFDEAGTFGINRGLCVPVHSPGGTIALMNVASHEDDATFHALVANHRNDLHVAAYYFHHRAAGLIAKARQAPVEAPLSQRERECLYWASAGKTAWETSQVLKLAETTVVYYLENAKRKLGTRTKAHAIARAFALGLIQP